MGCMLRSDHMTYCELFVQPESAFYIISRIGERGCVQFTDMNSEMSHPQKRFFTELCRCDGLERRMKYLKKEMDTLHIEPVPLVRPAYAMTITDVKKFEQKLDKWEDEVLDIAENDLELMRTYLELNELMYVLKYIGPLLGDAAILNNNVDLSSSKKKAAAARAAGDLGAGGRLVVITGVIKKSLSFSFERMLWRLSHGIIYYRTASEDEVLRDPHTRTEVRKVAFLAVCQGEELSGRLEKMCNGFRVNVYPCPHTLEAREDMIHKLKFRIDDMEHVLTKTRYLRCKALREISKSWLFHMTQLKKSKGVYFIMNQFTLDITSKCLIGRCWIADADIKKVQDIMHKATKKIQTNVPSFMSKIKTYETPPTYHRTNKFTRGFQNLINAYGESRYRELNPGLYTIITFPFLFAIMFGDLGHGLILLIFALWMLKNEAKFLKETSTNEIWNIFFGGRYIILLMGLFSIYTGFIYNDIFSRKFTLGLSAWINPYSVPGLIPNDYVDWDPRKVNRVYLYGMDPIWALATNQIMVINSIKMKLSIIMGVAQMIFGLILSFFNFRYFHKPHSIILLFIPQLIFLTFLFLYLVVMIFYKWFAYGARDPDPELGSACAPQILILFIDMALFSESEPIVEGCLRVYMFHNQRKIQMVLIVTALIMVPIMLFGTPIYEHRSNKKHKKIAEQALEHYKKKRHKDPKKLEHLEAQIEEYSLTFAEAMIHQGVHTIEFVLSTISHTASYLRLWALSLAHAQLSEMLWDMILSKLAIHDTSYLGFIKIFFIFPLWAIFTICILVVMEGLSAFLHTLRLHWVEFMSKFYTGSGKPFHPFTFRGLLDSNEKAFDAGC